MNTRVPYLVAVFVIGCGLSGCLLEAIAEEVEFLDDSELECDGCPDNSGTQSGSYSTGVWPFDVINAGQLEGISWGDSQQGLSQFSPSEKPDPTPWDGAGAPSKPMTFGSGGGDVLSGDDRVGDDRSGDDVGKPDPTPWSRISNKPDPTPWGTARHPSR
ncbi:MAG: hypothetical protein FWD57_00315 [Polyangiaceae bacterium]|nr:hypothetical protein [Polyangiaceae bacterium]